MRRCDRKDRRSGSRLEVCGLLTILLGGLAVLPPPVHAECIDYRDYIHRVSSTPMAGETYDVAVSGHHAFVADEVGLHILDISDPSLPLPVADLPLSGARSVVVQADYAYLANDEFGFFTVNLTEIDSPWIEGSHFIAGSPCHVEVEGNRAYVTAELEGLYVLDIADPADPILLAQHDTPDRAMDVEVQGDYAFIADFQHLVVVDLNSGSLAMDRGDRPGPSLVSIALRGDRAYLLDTTFGVFVYDISDPLSPQYVTYLSSGGSGGLEVEGDRLYAGSGYGLEIFDLANPDEPSLIGTLNTSWAPRGIDVQDDFVYLAIAERSLLDIADISNPSHPEPLASIWLTGSVEHLALKEPFAFVAARWAGLYTIDLSEPSSPVIVGDHDVLDYAYHIDIVGNLAYVAGAGDGLLVVDVTKPLVLQVIGAVLTPGDARCVDVLGDFAYVVDGQGLRVIDISAPEAPEIVGNLETPGYPIHVAVCDDHALIADMQQMLVVDISDPTDPRIADMAELRAEYLAVENDLVYVLGVPSLSVFSISDLLEAELVESILLPGYPMGLAFGENYAYAATGGGGLQILDYSDPTNLTGAGSVASYVFAVEVGEDYLFTVESSRFSVFPLQCEPTGLPDTPVEMPPRRAVLHPNLPNPFNPSTEIRFTLPEAGHTVMAIFDVAGRRLRVLQDGWQKAGEHRLDWDGRDEEGRLLGSGCYLARLRFDDQVIAHKLMLLK